MKRFIIFIILLLLLPYSLSAQTLEEKRRIEEGKRGNLHPTEPAVFQAQKVRTEPISPIDLEYFFGELISKRVTYRYDICKALVVLRGVEDDYINLDSQVAFLKKENLIPKKIESEFNPMEPIRKGLAAYMFCKAMGLRGGINLRLFGIKERYALKELVYEGIMAPGNPGDIMSGEELVSTLMQAIDYMKKAQ